MKRRSPDRLLLFGHDTIECAYYLQAGRGQGLDFEGLAIERERLRQSKSRDPKLVVLGGVEFLLQRYRFEFGVSDCAR